MRLAIIADIHGNIQALEAVYADLKAFAPDLVIVAGDMIGGGPDSRAVLEFLSTIDHLAIKGTHEDLMFDVIAGRVEPTFLEARIAVAEAEILGPQWIEYLESLPDHSYLNLLRERDVCVAHGVPGNTRRTILQNGREDDIERFDFLRSRYLTKEEMITLFNDLSLDLFITAHSHSQFCRPLWGTSVINPGTVRGEFCVTPDQILGEYAIVDLYRPTAGGHTWNPILRQVRWDMDAMYTDFERKAKTHPVLIEMAQYYETRASRLSELRIAPAAPQ